jgi:hypothetical protein
MGMEELGTLNLSDADMSAGDFDPIPAATYEVHVHQVTMVEVENDTGKLPIGTPGWNIQFRVDGGKYDNRVVFKRFYIPPVEYDTEKRKKSLGIFANFLVAIGYPKEEVLSGSFDTNPPEWEGKTCRASVRIRPAQKDADGDVIYPAQNEITSLKPLSAVSTAPGVL